MKTTTITINGIDLYTCKHSGLLLACNKAEGVKDIYDAKRIIEELLYTYVKENPYNERWSIAIETNDGTAVECSWCCTSSEEYDENITTFVDGERLQDRNNARWLLQAYEIGEAKWTISITDDKGWSEICEEWFNEHVSRVMQRYPEDFTDEERKRAQQARSLLSEY